MNGAFAVFITNKIPWLLRQESLFVDVDSLSMILMLSFEGQLDNYANCGQFPME